MIARLYISALFGVLIAAQNPVWTDAGAYSKEKEAALGASLAAEVRKRTSAIDDSRIHDYIERLANRLSAHLPHGDSTWEFAIIRDDLGGSTHEPLCFPGGHIFVPASLILAVHSEAELAGMLAHSMAHIDERHGTRVVTGAQATNHASIPLIFMGGSTGMGPGTDDRLMLPAAYVKVRRSYELDADRVAVTTMAAAGFEPAALRDYIGRTQRALPSQSETLSALPPRDERISALEAALTKMPSTVQAGGEFQEIQNRVRELAVTPPSPPRLPPSLRRKND